MEETPPALEPPRFALDGAWRQHLEDHGYVVVRDLLSSDELETADGLFWDWMESHCPLDRRLPQSWSNWLGNEAFGLINVKGAAHSDFMWFLRGRPGIYNLFTLLWATSQLLVSFDGFGAFRPPAVKASFATIGGWYHVDQGIRHPPGLQCAQGLLNLRHSGPGDGGFVVVPGSHKLHSQLLTLLDPSPETDFVTLPDEPDESSSRFLRGAVKLILQRGDFVLFDSRAIHCNAPISEKREVSDVQRLVAYICMLPAIRTPPDVQGRRKEALNSGIGSTHWSHRFVPSSAPVPGFNPPKLNGLQRRLAGLDS
eukprot:TRINITY_DN23879_c0_g1_i1.p1 TRINITY_DN23879_c0_g1~~TRINITY_DN23879_c0_g1_i1.p1  ORF type:complete len:311 (-),score=22.07 TRINITY_DN23879_c0_g1_i1:4-936(-)